MTITKEINDGKIVLCVSGWLDTLAADDFGKEIENLGDYTSLIIDCDNLEYVSSSGLRQLLKAQKISTEKNAEFSVINVSEEIMEVFSVTGFDEIIEIKAK